jgi:hypothetical protein
MATASAETFSQKYSVMLYNGDSEPKRIRTLKLAAHHVTQAG